MESCWAVWEAGCSVNWEAWSAIGSLAAAIVAAGLGYLSFRNAAKDQAHARQIVLGQLYAESQRIYFVAMWNLDFKRQIESGAIPSGFDPALKLALDDLASLNTHAFDLFNGQLLQAPRSVAGVVLYQYMRIKAALQAIRTTLEQSKDKPLQAQFDELSKQISFLQTAACNIEGDLARFLGYPASDSRDPGPESYVAWGLQDRSWGT